MINASLTPRRRAAELDALASGEQPDLLVIGGGITGTGIALDAASRGLSVALIEAHDLASGASRWSDGPLYGGVSRPGHTDVGPARENAVERDLLLRRTAPQLTYPMPQLLPVRTTTSRAQQAAVRAGLYADDALRRAAGTPSRLLPRPRSVPAEQALALVPGLQRSRLRGGLLSFDGALTDGARFVVTLARTAAAFGARILSRVGAWHVGGTQVRARDRITGDEVDFRARQVVNATGVWTKDLVESVHLHSARGSHLVLDAEACGVQQTAALIPTPVETARFVSLAPRTDGRVHLVHRARPAHLDRSDEPGRAPEDLEHVPVPDREFLLATASTVLDRTLDQDKVLGSHTSLYPLVETPHGRSTALSRDHLVWTDENSGVISAVGGTPVTYRRMAEEAVNTAVRLADLPAKPAWTARLPLFGAADRSALSTVDAPFRLVQKYGTEAPRVAALGAVDPELARPLFPGCETTAAEVVWAVRHEGALDADDVLQRRTRLGLVPENVAAAREGVEDMVHRTLHGLETS